MMILSMAGLYNAFFLWGAVFLNCSTLLSREVRVRLVECLPTKIKWDIPVTIFAILIVILTFRNCFFLAKALA